MSIPILTKEHFRQWVMAQNPNKKYNPSSVNRCAIAQYAHDMGFRNVTAGVNGFVADTGKKKFFGLFRERRGFTISGLRGHEIFHKKNRENTFGELAETLSSR